LESWDWAILSRFVLAAKCRMCPISPVLSPQVFSWWKFAHQVGGTWNLFWMVVCCKEGEPPLHSLRERHLMPPFGWWYAKVTDLSQDPLCVSVALVCEELKMVGRAELRFRECFVLTWDLRVGGQVYLRSAFCARISDMIWKECMLGWLRCPWQGDGKGMLDQELGGCWDHLGVWNERHPWRAEWTLCCVLGGIEAGKGWAEILFKEMIIFQWSFIWWSTVHFFWFWKPAPFLK
jgi:hypothetical protein